MNIVVKKSNMPDRYPLNPFSAMLVNVIFDYIIYFLPVFFPYVIWFGLMPMLLAFSQILFHGILVNLKRRSFYNPGLATIIVLQYPIGIYYIYYVTSQKLITGVDWVVAIIYTILASSILLGYMTFKLMPNRNTKYIFDKAEMDRYYKRVKAH